LSPRSRGIRRDFLSSREKATFVLSFFPLRGLPIVGIAGYFSTLGTSRPLFPLDGGKTFPSYGKYTACFFLLVTSVCQFAMLSLSPSSNEGLEDFLYPHLRASPFFPSRFTLPYACGCNLLTFFFIQKAAHSLASV